MADYCQECSINHFNKDFRELANPTQMKLPPKMGWMKLCECCGFVLVDDDGRLIDTIDKRRKNCCKDYKCHVPDPKPIYFGHCVVCGRFCKSFVCKKHTDNFRIDRIVGVPIVITGNDDNE